MDRINWYHVDRLSTSTEAALQTQGHYLNSSHSPGEKHLPSLTNGFSFYSPFDELQELTKSSWSPQLSVFWGRWWGSGILRARDMPMGFCTVLKALLPKSMGHQNSAVKKKPIFLMYLEWQSSTTDSILGAHFIPALVHGLFSVFW